MLYENIFFDLDSTLWDLEKNSQEVLSELIDKYELTKRGLPSETIFINHFKTINEDLWEAYRKDLIDRQTLRFGRFTKALQFFGIQDEELVQNMGTDYSALAPYRNNLLPHAIEILNYLKPNYHLHIITNGFEEIQHIKMKSSGLHSYFKEIITTDNSGYKKPDPAIFKHALSVANATISNSIMIGDSLEVDILGAKNVGMEAVFFNPNKMGHNHELKYEIESLNELKKIFD